MTDLIRLRYLADVNPPTPAFDRLGDAEEVSFLPLEAVWSDGRLDLGRSRPKAEVSTGYVRFARGDILCPKVTPTFQAGRAAFMTHLPTDVGAASTEVHVLRARPERADARYIRYGLLTKRFLEEGVSRFQGVAGLQRVPDSFVRNFEVADHLLDEQRRIAAFLDDQVARIDQAIALREKQVGLVSVIHRDLLAAAARSLGDVLYGNVPWFPQRPDWRVLPLKAVVRCLDFRRIPLSGEERSTRQGPYPYFGASTIVDYIDDFLFDGEFVLVGEDGASLDNFDFDVVQRVSGRIWVNNHAHVLEPRDDIEIDYLAHYLRSVDRKVLISGATRPKITQEDLLSLPVVLPPKTVQSTLVEITQATRSRAAVTRGKLVSAIELLQERKRSLITAAVTGEFDVSSASTRALAGVAP